MPYVSRRTPEFRDCFSRLTPSVQEQARETYREWAKNNKAAHFKTLASDSSLCSVRIGGSYRAVGVIEGSTVHWFWVGTKNEFRKAF